jgi:hypothetical protein
MNKHRSCTLSLECDHEIPLPPLPKMMASSISGNTDFEGLSEKYWGEILERTFSSNSLHALQQQHQQQQQQQQQQQHNHQQHQRHYQQQHQHNNNGKHHHFGNHTAFSDINLNRSDTNLYYSNSEPRLCEHDLHDINCAKNKAFFGAFNRIEDI